MNREVGTNDAEMYKEVGTNDAEINKCEMNKKVSSIADILEVQYAYFELVLLQKTNFAEFLVDIELCMTSLLMTICA